VLLFLFISLLHTTAAKLPQECPEDVSPCYCVKYDFNQNSVRCFEVPMEEVKATFNNLTIPFYIQWLDIVSQPPGDYIPADLLGQIRVLALFSFCGPSYEFEYPFLSVDPLAFRSSLINNTNRKSAYFYNLNMDRMDLRLNFSILVSIPPLPDFEYISFNGRWGFS